ncbi:MAG TPA: hypothetical protein VGV89_03805 [Thermoplasmata archaeon]|nr:hypothetical protein [Thermoplasmata archaeon]
MHDTYSRLIHHEDDVLGFRSALWGAIMTVVAASVVGLLLAPLQIPTKLLGLVGATAIGGFLCREWAEVAEGHEKALKTWKRDVILLEAQIETLPLGIEDASWSIFKPFTSKRVRGTMAGEAGGSTHRFVLRLRFLWIACFVSSLVLATAWLVLWGSGRGPF